MIKDGKLIYHLTALENLESILQHGLQPRFKLGSDKFEDIADGEILCSRASYRLDHFVPFHFFVKNPFDYGVQRSFPTKDFVLIAIKRSEAFASGWQIVPTHPLAGQGYRIFDYSTGFAAIDWELMEKRDYDDRVCKVTCMAECLSPTVVQPNQIFCIYVKNMRVKGIIDKILNSHKIYCHVSINAAMFVGE